MDTRDSVTHSVTHSGTINVNHSVTHSGMISKKDFTSDEAVGIINVVILVTLRSVVSLFGIIFNVCNIVVFVKQGLSYTVNIGLMGLTVSDLCSLITLEMMCVIRNPLLFKGGDIVVFEVQHLTAAWPHNTFARISSWITAYSTLERCLCVVVPLKIKTIITPRVTISVIVSIFVFMFLTLVPEYSACYLAWRFDPGRNRSVLGIVALDGLENMAAINFNLSAVTQLGSFGAIIFFTAFLVIKMNQKLKWRQSASSSGSLNTSNRDQKTMKMIILVASIFCICFLPMLCQCIATSLVPEFIIFGAYNNTFLAFWCWAFMLDGVNYSVNIFVYYRMSTKYRTTFNLLVQRNKKAIRRCCKLNNRKDGGSVRMSSLFVRVYSCTNGRCSIVNGHFMP